MFIDHLTSYHGHKVADAGLLCDQLGHDFESLTWLKCIGFGKYSIIMFLVCSKMLVIWVGINKIHVLVKIGNRKDLD